MESLYLLILLFFIILIIFPFSFKIYVGYDINLNDGYFLIKLCNIKLYQTSIKRRGKTIVLIEKRKNKDLEIEITEEQFRFLKILFNEIKNKIKIKIIDLESEVGAIEPFYSAIFSSIFSSIVLAIFARLKIKQPTASFKLNNNTRFFYFILKMNFFLKISISIFDVLYSLVVAVLKNKNDKFIEEKLRNI